MKILFIINDGDARYMEYEHTGVLNAPNRRAVEIELTPEQVEKGDNANALKELLVLYNAVEQSEQLVCSCGSRLVKTTGGYHCGNAKCSI